MPPTTDQFDSKQLQPVTLDYAAPALPGELLIDESLGNLTISLGPMTNTAFVTEVAGIALSITVCIAVLFNLSGIVALIIGLIAGISVLIKLARSRDCATTIKVAYGELYFSDARTGGKPRRVPPEIARIKLRRCWWRPWILQIDADPALKFLSIKSINPVTLAKGIDRSRAEQVAATLRNTLKLK